MSRIRISDEGKPVGGPEQLSSGAGVLNHVAPMSDDGKLTYTVTSFNEQSFKIPISSGGQKLGPVAELPLTEGKIYYSPSASRDGRWMVYIEAEVGDRSAIVLRDFATGTDRVLDERSKSPGAVSVSISPDGSKIVFNRDCNLESQTWNCPSFLVPATGGEPAQVCGNCQPRGFSSDGSFVLMQS